VGPPRLVRRLHEQPGLGRSETPLVPGTLARIRQPAVCVVCGARPVELHHLDYGRLGNEKHDDITALCHAHHARNHLAWDATPHLRRLGRRAATIAVVQAMRRDLGR